MPSTDLVEIYKIADTFVMPSLVETFGIVLVEAMASRLPIISTSAPGCVDVISVYTYPTYLKCKHKTEIIIFRSGNSLVLLMALFTHSNWDTDLMHNKP